MSNAVKALEFLKDDIDKAKEQWREGKEFKSLLQREGKDFEELIKLFDPKPDENDWSTEYNDKKDRLKLCLYRKRIAFLCASLKEFHEEYDDDVTDVDFMRLLEVPYVDSKFAVENTIDEFQDKK